MGLLILVHTVPPLLEVFNRLAGEILPAVKLKHILDEPLLEAVRQRGGLEESDAERLRSHVMLAESIGANAVLVTCSTISPLVEQIRPQIQMPIFPIDEAMIEQAVQAGPRIGVLATNPTTIEPTRELLLDKARSAGKAIELETKLVPNALQAFLAGDGSTHDRLLAVAITDIAPHVDSIVLAQASMARVLEALPPEALTKPVFSSPHLVLEKLQVYFKSL